jgi:hypothetical protein
MPPSACAPFGHLIKSIYLTNAMNTTSTDKQGPKEIASSIPLSPVEVQVSRLFQLAAHTLYTEGEETYP